MRDEFGRSRVRRVASPLVALFLGSALLTSCGSSSPDPRTAVARLVADLAGRRWSAVAAASLSPPADLAAEEQGVLDGLGVRSARYATGAVVERGNRASAPVTDHLALADGLVVTLHSVLELRLSHNRWLLEWSPLTIDGRLRKADRFALAAEWPPRASVLGAGGASLVPPTTTVTVGLAGYRIADPATLQSQLLAAGLEKTAVATALGEAKRHPREFEPIQTLSLAAYEAVKAIIQPLPGTQFETQQQDLPLTAVLGAQIVGQIGPITAEQLHVLGPPYGVGDQVGQGGIEGSYERRLAGSPALRAEIVAASGAPVALLAMRPAVAGTPVRTTITPDVQLAAESALGGVTEPAAIVVMRPSTGDVLASASVPADGFDLALGATVPPGSTFKVITSAALLGSGVTPATSVTCPPSVGVDGRSFVNDEGESLPSLSFTQAFAQSCNTAFIGLASRLNSATLPAEARLFGIGVTPSMGLAAYGGSVPTPRGAVELAATAIGQGQVTVSPLVMATVASAVAAGALREPRLVVGAPDDALPARPLDQKVAAELRGLMGAVVAGGTAAGRGLPAATIGKTGTAEYGAGPKPPTHAWFIGSDGDLAFAVLVYGGGVGGSVAAPLAAKVLGALGSAA